MPTKLIATTQPLTRARETKKTSALEHWAKGPCRPADLMPGYAQIDGFTWRLPPWDAVAEDLRVDYVQQANALLRFFKTAEERREALEGLEDLFVNCPDMVRESRRIGEEAAIRITERRRGERLTTVVSSPDLSR